MSYAWTKPDLPPNGKGPSRRPPGPQKARMPLADKIHRTAVTGLVGLFLFSSYYLGAVYWSRRQQRLAILDSLTEEERRVVIAGGSLPEERTQNLRAAHQERRGILSDGKGSAG